MKMRICALASVALAALAAPALAGGSTPAEREATRQLNLEAARQAQNSNQTLQNAPQVTVADPSANLPANSPPAAAPTTPVQTASIANPDSAAPALLSSIQRPPSKIATANVLDASGQIIGAVQRVDLTPDGMPAKVAVALTGKEGKLAVLNANEVKYDLVKNEILAQRTGAEIRSKAS
jgi:hypothetical protein